MQYKILASDYDNTLVPFGESQPRPAVVKAVKKLQASGGKFVLSTGRAWSAINRKGQLAASGSTTPSPATVPVSWTETAPSSPSIP